MILSAVVVVQILINALVYIPVADPEGALHTLMMLFTQMGNKIRGGSHTLTPLALVHCSSSKGWGSTRGST